MNKQKEVGAKKSNKKKTVIISSVIIVMTLMVGVILSQKLNSGPQDYENNQQEVEDKQEKTTDDEIEKKSDEEGENGDQLDAKSGDLNEEVRKKEPVKESTPKPKEKPKVEKPNVPKVEKPKSEKPKVEAPKEDKPVEKPKHEHVWEEVYKDHEATYRYEYVEEEFIMQYLFINGDDEERAYVDYSVIQASGYTLGKYARHVLGWDRASYQTHKKVTKEGYMKEILDKPAWKELTHYVCKADGVTKVK